MENVEVEELARFLDAITLPAYSRYKLRQALGPSNVRAVAKAMIEAGYIRVAPPAGIEPATHEVEARRSSD